MPGELAPFFAALQVDCLSLKEIYNLCFLVEKVFSKECSTFECDSMILLYALAEKKAKCKFRWFTLHCNVELSEDTLVSYEEFCKSLKDDSALYETFLPPPLEMKQVLVRLIR